MAMTEMEIMDNADYRLEQAIEAVRSMSRLLEKTKRQMTSVYVTIAEAQAENRRMREVLECAGEVGDTD